jgi:DNA-binding NtrC family response regulator
MSRQGDRKVNEVQATAKLATGSTSEEAKCIHHILIVDDEVEFVGSVRRHLKRRGFCPDFAFNGESACHKMLSLKQENRRYDLVITDVVMPRMDGISLLQWIHGRFPETSVIVVSEFMNLAQLETKIRPELDAVGRKPMIPDQMMGLIESISSKRWAWKRENGESQESSTGEYIQSVENIVEIYPEIKISVEVESRKTGVWEN